METIIADDKNLLNILSKIVLSEKENTTTDIVSDYIEMRTKYFYEFLFADGGAYKLSTTYKEEIEVIGPTNNIVHSETNIIEQITDFPYHFYLCKSDGVFYIKVMV